MGSLTPLTPVEMWQNCDPEMQLKTSSKYPGMFSQNVNPRKENVSILLTVGEYGKKIISFYKTVSLENNILS